MQDTGVQGVLICLLQATVGVGDTSHLESPSPTGQTSIARLSSPPTLPYLPPVLRGLIEAGAQTCVSTYGPWASRLKFCVLIHVWH